MSEITIEIVEDRDHPEGGHALIRLNGLWLLPANATYRIEPEDNDDDAALPDGWPHDDRTPLATRLTPHGVEIVAGPDVVDAPPLLPGTRVAISIPAAFVRVVTVWPELPQSKPMLSPQGLLTAAELAAELEAEAEAQRQNTDAPILLHDIDLLPASKATAESDHEHAVNGVALHDYAPERDLRLSELTLREDRPSFLPPESSSRPGVEVAPGQGARLGDSSPAFYPVVVKATVEEPQPVYETETARPYQANIPQVVMDARQKALVPVAKSLPPVRRRQLSIAVPFVIGVLIAGGLTALIATKQIGPLPAVPSFAEGVSPPSTLSDVLTVAVTSPLGRDATDVDLQTALKLADERLQTGQGEADRNEASFWLKKALTLSVGTPQLAWTLTQLGSVYAQPASGVVDYGKARLLWEMAASSGDVVALCFLGQLHENGLGVARSHRAALDYYERAKARGGCRGVDAAIARVRG